MNVLADCIAQPEVHTITNKSVYANIVRFAEQWTQRGFMRNRITLFLCLVTILVPKPPVDKFPLLYSEKNINFRNKLLKYIIGNL